MKIRATTILSVRRDGFVAMGGDGTVRAVANQLQKTGSGLQIPLAIVPLGTENLIARQFKITADIDSVASAIHCSASSRSPRPSTGSSRTIIGLAGRGRNSKRGGPLGTTSTIMNPFASSFSAMDVRSIEPGYATGVVNGRPARSLSRTC